MNSFSTTNSFVTTVNEKLNEQPIKNLVIFLLLKHGENEISKQEIMAGIFEWQKLDAVNAESVFSAMIRLGLGVCKDSVILDYEIPLCCFSLSEFSMIRGYHTSDEIKKFDRKANPHKYELQRAAKRFGSFSKL